MKTYGLENVINNMKSDNIPNNILCQTEELLDSIKKYDEHQLKILLQQAYDIGCKIVYVANVGNQGVSFLSTTDCMLNHNENFNNYSIPDIQLYEIGVVIKPYLSDYDNFHSDIMITDIDKFRNYLYSTPGLLAKEIDKYIQHRAPKQSSYCYFIINISEYLESEKE